MQAKACKIIADRVRKEFCWDVWSFSGFTYEVIKEYDLTKPFDAMKKGLELLEMPKKKAIKTAISRFDAQVQS